MGRGSRQERQAQRAHELLARALKRGDALEAAEAWLSLPPEVRSEKLSAVQTLVAEAFDEARKAKARARIQAFWPHLERARELILQMPGEPADAERERWWLAMWAAGLAKDFKRARRAWREIEAPTRAAAPRLAVALEAWLDQGLDAASLEPLAGLLGGAPTDPRLGIEPVRPRPKLEPPVHGEDVEPRVLAALVQRPMSAAVSQVLGWMSGPARAHAGAVARVAAPVLLREALLRALEARGAPAEALRWFFEIVAAAPVDARRALAPAQETAVRWVFRAALAGDGSPPGTSLVARATAFGMADPHLRGPVRSALAQISVEALPPADRHALWLELLKGPGVDPGVWLSIVGADPGSEPPGALFEALARAMPEVRSDPAALAGALDRAPPKTRRNALDVAGQCLPLREIEAVIDGCWESAGDESREWLASLLVAALERADREAREARLSAVGMPTLEGAIAAGAEAMLAEGEDPMSVIDTLCGEIPADATPGERKRVLDAVRQAVLSYRPSPTSAARMAMWGRLGARALPYHPDLLDDALSDVRAPHEVRGVVMRSLERVTRLEAWLARGHQMHRKHGPAVGMLAFAAVGERFGDRLDVWGRACAWACDEACHCAYSERVVAHFLECAAEAAETERAPHEVIIRRARKDFPGVASRVDGRRKGAAKAAKRGKGAKRGKAAKPAKQPKPARPRTPEVLPQQGSLPMGAPAEPKRRSP